MIDIHSHIIQEIDDGSTSIEESLAILKKLKKLGFSAVIATPHYMQGSTYAAENATKIDKISVLYEEIEKQKLGIKIYLGNEVFIFDELEEAIQKEKVSTMNDSRYILIELPFGIYPVHLDHYIFTLIDHGYVPIIAHPERYSYFQKDPSKIYSLVEQGALFQCNYSSLLGKYGTHAKETFLYLLEHNLIHFLATDLHSVESTFYERFDEIKQMILEKIKEEKWMELTETNPRKVIRNEEIEITEPIIDTKKSLFSFFGHS